MDEVNNTTQGTVNGSTIPQADRQSATDTVEIVVEGQQIAQPPEVPQIANNDVTPISEDKQRNEKGQFVPGNTASVGSTTNGRPCKFCENKEEYLTKAQAYLEKCKTGVNGKPVMPFIEELALEMNTTDENIVNWADKMIGDTKEREHPDFFPIYSLVKMLQKLRLKQRALGRYNPVGALTLLRFDHGAVEVNKKILAGDATTPLEILITEEDRKKDGE